mmetsp:Transcript_22727/g.56654  ORF Transcript_22727/g.56654 Transcript_22727/m.56654 type:complete len:419 (+) Transcript_22727:675-1931(+)
MLRRHVLPRGVEQDGVAPQAEDLDLNLDLATLLVVHFGPAAASFLIDLPPTVRLGQHITEISLAHRLGLLVKDIHLSQCVVAGAEHGQVRIKELDVQMLLGGVHQEVVPTILSPMRLQRLLYRLCRVLAVADLYPHVGVGRGLAEQVPVLALQPLSLDDSQSDDSLWPGVLHRRDVDLSLAAPDPMDKDPIGQHQQVCEHLLENAFQSGGDLRELYHLRQAGELPRDARGCHHGDLEPAHNRHGLHQRSQDQIHLTFDAQPLDADGHAWQHRELDLGVAIPLHTDRQLYARVVLVELPGNLDRAELWRGAAKAQLLLEVGPLKRRGHRCLDGRLDGLLDDLADGLVDKGPYLRHREVEPLQLVARRPGLDPRTFDGLPHLLQHVHGLLRPVVRRVVHGLLILHSLHLDSIRRYSTLVP